MKIDHPAPCHFPRLLQLWKDVFGEWGGFWELFRDTAFSPDRCRCILDGDTIAASLCWLDVWCEGQKMAYLYAVVTDPAHRGRGLCRRLMADTHAHLAALGYEAVLLVPAEESLREMYRKLGYRDATTVTEFSCAAGEGPASLRAIGPEEYAALRRKFLPSGSVIQEGENLTFLSRQAEFFTGEDFLLAAYRDEEILHTMELLGNAQTAPAIVHALDCQEGAFRTPGPDKPFAMFHPLKEDAAALEYFGFAFD